jgi:hypothetical protein
MITGMRRELAMVSRRLFYMHKRVVVVDLNDEMVEVHPDFRYEALS